MGKRFYTLILIVMLMAGTGCFSTSSAYGQSGNSQGPEAVAADSAILVDATTGKILYEKNKDKQEYPASTTKVMTALLACENLDFNKTVTIDKDTPYTEGSRIYLVEGEQLTIQQLFMSMLVESANDSAVALAKQVSGSVDQFAALMNKRAKELGALHTNFVTPNGLHNPEHMTTAYDLSLITREALKHEEFRKAVDTYHYYIPATNKQAERNLYNGNRLLYDTSRTVVVNGVKRPIKYDGAIGIKTGYTPEAGNCLIAGAKRGDTELIAVMMKSNELYQDAITLLDYGFDNYKSVPVVAAKTKLGDIKVRRGSVQQVSAVAPSNVAVTLPVGATDGSVVKKVELEDVVDAPVKQGQKVGTVKLYDKNETLLGQFDAVAKTSISKGGLLSAVGISDKTAHSIYKVLFRVALVILVIAMILFLLKRRRLRRRRIRRQQREERRYLRELEAKEFWEAEFHEPYPRTPRPIESLPSSTFRQKRSEDKEKLKYLHIKKS